jgi:predicted PolB exonuclease-like 3'-5' exonuclease
MSIVCVLSRAIAESLDVIASILGLPGKIGGHGSEIQGMFERGEVEKIRAYCECDCLNLFGLYLRWCMLIGRIDETGFDDCRKFFEAFLEKERLARAHYGEFLDGWRSPAITPVMTRIEMGRRHDCASESP